MRDPSPSKSERARISAYLTATVPKETERCLANLLAYRAARARAQLPRGASAAVLVPLFVGRSGDVYVLLSRRSDALRTFAGDTALPGGRIDAQDWTVEDAARREAFEEIGLPTDKERVPLLCAMEPHLARGEIVVTPVVVLILDHTLQPNLNASEVTSIFAQPLITFLSSTLPPHHRSGGRRTTDPNSPHHTFTDVSWGDGDGVVRLHRFLTGGESEGVKPVFGLTASILIKVATIGYGRPPDFEVRPPNAPTPWQQIARALLMPGNPLRVACELEGIDANEVAARLLLGPLPVAAAEAVRTVERERIGAKRKELLEGGSPMNGARVTGSGATSRLDRRCARECVGETKARMVEHARGGADGPGATIEGCEKHACERRNRQAVSPDLDKLCTSLDETRYSVKERTEETRKVYPDIAAWVKEYVGALRCAFDLAASVPKEGRMVNTKCRARGYTVERGLEGMNDDAGKGRDDDPEQAISSKKRNAKL